MSRAHDTEGHLPTSIFQAEVLGFLALRDRERKGSREWRDATDQFVYDVVAAASRYRAAGIATVKELKAARIQEVARLTVLLQQAQEHACDCGSARGGADRRREAE